ncbi:uncharacterized protein UBRO_21012 [Ustilago bromivora]|uniref:Uncharacterized protein n=1 Tax=Ustilago bromivora TaxID=307758 RepID=A0A1K0H9K6_9BASI|nr:uncharacterized protein UBRO_21012 [Ustilago bromivora]
MWHIPKYQIAVEGVKASAPEMAISYFVSQEEVCDVDVLCSLEVLWIIGNNTSTCGVTVQYWSGQIEAITWIADIFGSDWSSSRRNMGVHNISLAAAASAIYSASTELFATVG